MTGDAQSPGLFEHPHDAGEALPPKKIELNEAQRRAVEFDTGPLAVLAGPGTGKTRVLTARVAHMIAERRIEPEQIVALTFSNKAARELRERLTELLGFGPAERVTAKTFHAFGLDLVRRYADRAGFAKTPTISDSAQERRLLRQIVRENEWFGHARGQAVETAADHARSIIAQLRHGAVSPDRAEQWAENAIANAPGEEHSADVVAPEDLRDAARTMRAFDAACRREGLVTFDQLVQIPTQLIADDARVAQFVRDTHRHVLVDEFQDANTQQIEFLRELCPPGARPDLCVVGDDDQSIYGFRGADERAFDRFARVWRGPEVIALTQNFRSASRIVGVANEIIAQAHTRFRPDKTAEAARAELGAGEVIAVELENGQKQQSGEVIALDLLEQRRAGALKKWSDAAVIVRTRAELERVTSALWLEGVPIRRAGEVTRDEGVRDVLAWIDLLCEPQAPWAARRPMSRPPFAVTRETADRLERAHREGDARAEVGEGSAPGSFGAFARAWMREHLDESHDDHARLSRFLDVLDDLSTTAAEAPAAEAVFEIVRKIDAAHADLLSPRQRAVRVAALVRLLTFVRACAPRIEQPSGLRELRAHVGDLDEKERWGDRAAPQIDSELPDASEDADLSDSDDASDAVVVLTGHSSKGLEFPFVYVAAVHPDGFPLMRSMGDDIVLPDALLDLADDPRDRKQRRADEERRVFYVACTRAERRLMLTGTIAKTTKSMHFLRELMSSDLVTTRDAETIVSDSDRRDVLERFGAKFAARRDASDRLDRAAARLRARAGDALERATTDADSAAASLDSIARHMAVLGYVRTNADVPEWADEQGLGDYARELLGKGEPEQADLGMRAPLNLSYSMISDYLTCPRCFYIKRVLKLGEPPSSTMAIGQAVHESLHEHYTRWRDMDAEGIPPEQRPGRSALDETARLQTLGSWPAALAFEPDAVRRVQRLVGVLWDELHDDDANIVELERKVVFPWVHAGKEHRFTAKLDRVDQVQTDDGRVIDKIIDYKTGAATKSRLDPKELATDVQMGVYVHALRHLRDDPELDGVCEYWILTTGEVGRVAFSSIKHESIEKKINKAIDGMLAGEFDRCGCQGKGVCCVLGG